LLGVILTLTGAAVSVPNWQTSKIAASYGGLLSSCVGCAHPFDYQDSILQASAGDVFLVHYSTSEPESEVFVAILNSAEANGIIPQSYDNMSLEMLRQRVRNSAKDWIVGHSGAFEWTVDTTGSYGLIVVPYRALVSPEGTWQIEFHIVVEQSTRNFALTNAGYAIAAIGSILITWTLLRFRPLQKSF
jgi:hypothetical protein